MHKMFKCGVDAMPDETVSIKKSSAYLIGVILLVSAVGIAALGSVNSLAVNSFAVSFVFAALIIGWAAYYMYSNRKELSEMCCMMSGMTFGMMSGFAVGIIYGIATGDFLAAAILSTIAGLLVGVVIGRAGGPLARMEGVMSGPMGGTMGAMIGVMIRFYDMEIFMPFFFIILVLTMFEMSYMVSRNVDRKMPSAVKYSGILLAVFAVLSSVVMTYPVEGSQTLSFGNAQAVQAAPQAEGARAVLKNGYQEVSLRAEPLGYAPATIIAKKDVPLRINMAADASAGCTRSIVFPDFGVTDIVPAGSSKTIEFTPDKTGRFSFRCSMNMARGTLIIEN